MKKILLALFLCATTLSSTACGGFNSLLGGSSAGTINALWADVPPLAQAEKTDLQMPLAVNLAVKAALKGQVEFIAYTSPQPTADVANFYTQEQMTAAGWDKQSPGCQTGKSGADTGNAAGGMCFFTRKEGTDDVMLMIIAADDPATKKTQIFYMRAKDVKSK